MGGMPTGSFQGGRGPLRRRAVGPLGMGVPPLGPRARAPWEARGPRGPRPWAHAPFTLPAPPAKTCCVLLDNLGGVEQVTDAMLILV